MNKKKWYVGKVSAEGDRVFTFQATEEEAKNSIVTIEKGTLKRSCAKQKTGKQYISRTGLF